MQEVRLDRYSRNMEMLTLEENISLRSKKIAVIGCGGLGGYIIEMLARLGVGPWPLQMETYSKRAISTGSFSQIQG